MVGLRSLLADVDPELVFFETPENAEVELRRMGSAWVRLGIRELARNSNQSRENGNILAYTMRVHASIHGRPSSRCT